MRYGLLLAVVLVAGCTVVPRPGPRAVAPADFYVATNGRDEWSGKLAEPNADRSDGPFASVERARDAVREVVKAGLTRDVAVLVRGGTYYVPKGIVFGPQDSGTAEHSITYAAYPGEVPVLLGGVRIIAWQEHDGKIRKAAVPEGTQPNQLFENGRRLALARSPNKGYHRLEAAVKGKPKAAFVYRARDLRPQDWQWQEGRVFLWPTHDWFSTSKPIAGIDTAKRIVHLEGDGGYAIKPGNRYFVQNVLQILDSPGECVIRLNEWALYCWPREEPIAERHIVAATADQVLRVEGRGETLVRNLHFRGLDLGIARGDVVKFQDAADCSVRFSTIENGGECGAMLAGACQRIALYGNLIRFHGHHGVSLAGRGYDKPAVNHHNIIENNHIHHCGRLLGHGYGVRLWQSGHSRVVHNHIHHMPRYATTIKGLRYQSLRTAIKGVTWENRHDFLHSRNNLIAYNHIHHTNLDSQDTGALESWGPGRDNVYDHNLIHDTGNDQFTIQSGMYLDDATDYFTVTNNIIYGVRGTGGDQPIYVKGIGNRIENNILLVGPTNTSAIRSLYMAQERCDNHAYTRNIIVFEGEPQQPKGAFGRSASMLHAAGTTLRWQVAIPADGDYHVWLRYACANQRYGYATMDGRTTMQVDDGKPVPLVGIADTGGWGTQKWSGEAATLRLAKGERTTTWVNVKGGGLNWDAFVLCSDSAWKPSGTELDPPVPGRHLVVVQAEDHTRPKEPQDRRAIYDFNNWSDDRVAECDFNLYWKPTGQLAIKGGPVAGSYDKWREILGRKFDQHSLVADPQFVDLAGRDFRLKPTSPALKLGFRPIDTGRIGLKGDFPARFEKE